MAIPDKYTKLVPILVLVLLIAASGVAGAQVTGEFSSTYSGYDEAQDSNGEQNQIETSGTLEFEESNVVDVTIRVYQSDNAVLDYSSVELLQPGDSSIEFDRFTNDNGVVYAADEIQSGTTVELSYESYAISGLDQDEIESSTVTVTYRQPGGEETTEEYDVTTQLENTPNQVIADLNEQAGLEGTPGWGDLGILFKILTVLGGIMILVLVVTLILWITSSNGGNGTDI